MTNAESRRPGAAAVLVLGIAALGSLGAAVGGLPLAWDGSAFLFTALNDQRPLLVFHRLVESLLTAPVVLASAVTSDLAALAAIFSLSYAAVPVVALALSWIVVRRDRPDLFVWPVLGTALALLPGRAVYIAESTIAAELSWPLFLAAVGRPRPTTIAVCLGCGAVVAVSHPIGLVLLVVVAVVGAIERRRPRSAALAWATAFAILAGVDLVQLVLQLDPYEIQSMRPLVVGGQLVRSVLGPQLTRLLLPAAAAALAYGGRGDPSRERLSALALVAVALAGCAFVMWAAVPSMWRGEIDYRAWALPATLALFPVAWADARRSPSTERYVADRMRLCVAAAGVMAVVLVLQTATWGTLVDQVRAAVRGRDGCVAASSIGAFPDSALGSWTITPLSLVVQGRDARAFVAPDELCASADWPREVPLASLPSLHPAWFRFGTGTP